MNWKLCRNKPPYRNLSYCFTICGPGRHSRYKHSLRAGRSGSRIAVGARFSSPVQTVPGAQPAFCTMGRLPFPRAKRPGHDFHHPLTSCAEVEERLELHLYSPSKPPWPVIKWTLLISPFGWMGKTKLWSSAKRAGRRDEIWTRDFHSTKQLCYFWLVVIMASKIM